MQKYFLCCLMLLLFFFCVTAGAQESTASRQVSTFTIDSPELQTSRKIWVYLPKGYSESQKRYPVLYMHDAQNLFDSKTSFVGE